MGAAVKLTRADLKPPRRAQPDTGIYVPLRDTDSIRKALRDVREAPESGHARVQAVRLMLTSSVLIEAMPRALKTRFNREMKKVRIAYATAYKRAGF